MHTNNDKHTQYTKGAWNSVRIVLLRTILQSECDPAGKNTESITVWTHSVVHPVDHTVFTLLRLCGFGPFSHCGIV